MQHAEEVGVGEVHVDVLGVLDESPLQDFLLLTVPGQNQSQGLVSPSALFASQLLHNLPQPH